MGQAEQNMIELMTGKRPLAEMCSLEHDHLEWKNCEKPLQDGYPESWTWSKRHRSEEVILPDPTLRKGE